MESRETPMDTPSRRANLRRVAIEDPSKTLLRYWRGLPRRGKAPLATDIDANAVASIVGHVVMAEIVGPRDWRILHAGRVIRRRLGRDVTGVPIGHLFTPSERILLPGHFAPFHRDGLPVALSLRSTRYSATPSISAALCLMPLCNEAGRVIRAIGTLTMTGTLAPGDMPDFRVEDAAIPGRPHHPAPIAPATVEAAIDLADDLIARRRARPMRRPTLRVIEGGRA